MKNNPHLDFMKGFISTSGINTAFFHPKKWQNMLKIDFLGCHGNGWAAKRMGPIFLIHVTEGKIHQLSRKSEACHFRRFLVLINNYS